MYKTLYLIGIVLFTLISLYFSNEFFFLKGSKNNSKNEYFLHSKYNENQKKISNNNDRKNGIIDNMNNDIDSIIKKNNIIDENNSFTNNTINKNNNINPNSDIPSVTFYISRSLGFPMISYPSSKFPGDLMESKGEDYYFTFKDITNISNVNFVRGNSYNVYRLFKEAITVFSEGEYRVNEDGVKKITSESDYIIILIERYLGEATIYYDNDIKIILSELSEDKKDWICRIKDKDKITLKKANIGNLTYEGHDKLIKGEIYRIGWKKSDSGDDHWENDKRKIVLMKTVEIYTRIEQKENYQMYLSHFQHDDETNEVCDLSRTAYWDSVPCGTELSKNLYKDGYYMRKFRAVYGNSFIVRPTLGSWGTEAYVHGSYSEHFSIKKKAMNGLVITLSNKNKEGKTIYDFVSKTDGKETEIYRPPMLTFKKSPNGSQKIQLIWTGSEDISWGLLNGEKVIKEKGKKTKINGKYNGYSYIFDDTVYEKNYFYKINGKKYVFKGVLSDNTNKFQFSVFGDSQSPEKKSYLEKCVENMRKHAPDFAVSVGDFSNDGNIAKNWENMFFKPIVSNLYETKSDKKYQIPIIAAPGNHDRFNSLFKDYFAQEYRYNHFVYGNALFMTIDVEGEFNPGSLQYEWIVETLKNDNHKWKIMFMHESPFCYAPRHYSNYRIRKYLHPLFKQYKVNAVFAGHIHTYNHPKTVENIEYINLPCMGSSTPDQDKTHAPSNEAPMLTKDMFEGDEYGPGVYKFGVQGYAMVYMSDDIMTVKILNHKDEVIEKFTIENK